MTPKTPKPQNPKTPKVWMFFSFLMHPNKWFCYNLCNMSSEGNCLLLEFKHVLVINSKILKFAKLCLLNSFNLVSLILDVLSNFSTFFEIVKSVLFFISFVGWDLTSDLFGVIDKSLSFFFFNFLLLCFNLLLLLDLIHVVFSLNSSLFSKTGLLLWELLLSSHFKISHDSLTLLVFKSLSFSSLSFTFLECSLSSKCIDLSLSISSLFLKLS